MGIRIVREPSASYIVRSGTNYYAEDDVTLTTSLGTTDADCYGVLFNTVYGKILLDVDGEKITYLVATSDLEIQSNDGSYNSIVNDDDIIALRYAYGNQDGYLVGIGTELSAEYNNGTFTVNSGRAVIQGLEVNIDANGASVELETGVYGYRYYNIYLKANKDSSVAELVAIYSTNGWEYISDPVSGNVLYGEDVYMLLYRISLSGAEQVEEKKMVSGVQFHSRRLIWSGNQNLGLSGSSTIFGERNNNYNVDYEIHCELDDGQTFIVPFHIGEHLDADGNSPTHYWINPVIRIEYSGSYQITTQVMIHKTNIFYGKSEKIKLQLSTNTVTRELVDLYVKEIYEIR